MVQTVHPTDTKSPTLYTLQTNSNTQTYMPCPTYRKTKIIHTVHQEELHMQQNYLLQAESTQLYPTYPVTILHPDFFRLSLGHHIISTNLVCDKTESWLLSPSALTHATPTYLVTRLNPDCFHLQHSLMQHPPTLWQDWILTAFTFSTHSCNTHLPCDKTESWLLSPSALTHATPTYLVTRLNPDCFHLQHSLMQHPPTLWQDWILTCFHLQHSLMQHPPTLWQDWILTCFHLQHSLMQHPPTLWQVSILISFSARSDNTHLPCDKSPFWFLSAHVQTTHTHKTTGSRICEREKSAQCLWL